MTSPRIQGTEPFGSDLPWPGMDSPAKIVDRLHAYKNLSTSPKDGTHQSSPGKYG